MNEVRGHEQQKLALIHSLEKQTLPHAMIFSGSQGVGKFKLAKAFAQVLICETKSNNACGVCGSCIRVAKNQSENLKVIATENSQQIKIDQIRSVLDFLSLSSYNQNRVIIIDQAQDLNPQAANSLLKTLEEPFENVFFILVTPDVRLLMATIRSRAQVINFSLLSQDDLKNIKPDLADWMYASSRGSASRLQSLAQSELTDKRHEHLKFFEGFWLNKEFLLSAVVKEFVKDRASAHQIIQDWLQFTRDLLYFKQDQADLLINSDFRPHYRDLLFLNLEQLQNFAAALMKSEHELDKADLTLFFESLWVKYARAN